ncbi:MAG: hypothetical protein R2849_03420 [Thermomicrobiales bacterium]
MTRQRDRRRYVRQRRPRVAFAGDPADIGQDSREPRWRWSLSERLKCLPDWWPLGGYADPSWRWHEERGGDLLVVKLAIVLMRSYLDSSGNARRQVKMSQPLIRR